MKDEVSEKRGMAEDVTAEIYQKHTAESSSKTVRGYIRCITFLSRYLPRIGRVGALVRSLDSYLELEIEVGEILIAEGADSHQ